MFQLTKEEWSILKSQIATSKQFDNQSNDILKSQNATSSWGGTRKLPYAFTREGIGMLSSVLSLLIKRGKGVSATIHSRFTKDFLTDLEKHNKQYDEVKFVQLPHKNHDRFLIIDDTVYLLGASVKDMGNGLCAVTKLTATPETVLRLLK